MDQIALRKGGGQGMVGEIITPPRGWVLRPDRTDIKNTQQATVLVGSAAIATTDVDAKRELKDKIARRRALLADSKSGSVALRARAKARLSRAVQQARALRDTCEALESFAIAMATFA